LFGKTLNLVEISSDLFRFFSMKCVLISNRGRKRSAYTDGKISPSFTEHLRRKRRIMELMGRCLEVLRVVHGDESKGDSCPIVLHLVYSVLVVSDVERAHRAIPIRICFSCLACVVWVKERVVYVCSASCV
jgi:hypothetical protein